MSSQLTQYVSVFDGNGWLLWCSQMRAYLMAQGQGAFITPGSSEPSVNAAPAALGANASATEINTFNEANHVRAMQIAACNEWHKLNDMTVGNIMLCLSPALQQGLCSHDNAAKLWDVLKNTVCLASKLFPLSMKTSRRLIPFGLIQTNTPQRSLTNLQQHLIALPT